MTNNKAEKLFNYRSTLWQMALAMLKTKYSGSLLGIFWAVINPFLVMSVITFVFVVVFKTGVPNFHIFVLSGIFPWMFFSNSLTEASTSIISQQNIMRQFSVPIEIIPLASILANFLNFLIGWIFIYPVFLVYNHNIIVLFPYLALGLFLLLLFTCGLGILFSCLNVFFRDIGQLLSVLLMFWFWITPVFYSVDMVPMHFNWIYLVNPMAKFISFFRDLTFLGVSPARTNIIAVIVCSVSTLIIGWLVFNLTRSKIIKRL